VSCAYVSCFNKENSDVSSRHVTYIGLFSIKCVSGNNFIYVSVYLRLVFIYQLVKCCIFKELTYDLVYFLSVVNFERRFLFCTVTYCGITVLLLLG
jgi:hypothetical protein